MTHLEWYRSFFTRVWSETDLGRIDAAIEELVSEDCLVLGLPHQKNLVRDGFKAFRRSFHAAFERAEVEVHEVLSQGDRVALRATLQFWRDGKRYTAPGGGFATIRDGVIVEAYNQWDFLGLLEQLGAVGKQPLEQHLAALAARS